MKASDSVGLKEGSKVMVSTKLIPPYHRAAELEYEH